jgi:hypothetical protein
MNAPASAPRRQRDACRATELEYRASTPAVAPRPRVPPVLSVRTMVREGLPDDGGDGHWVLTPRGAEASRRAGDAAYPDW